MSLSAPQLTGKLADTVSEQLEAVGFSSYVELAAKIVLADLELPSAWAGELATVLAARIHEAFEQAALTAVEWDLVTPLVH